jgi:hypothetical protein
VPVDQHDVSKGWEELDTGGLSQTPESLGLKDGGIVAFAFSSGGENRDAKPEFVVEFSDEAALYPEEE